MFEKKRVPTFKDFFFDFYQLNPSQTVSRSPNLDLEVKFALQVLAIVGIDLRKIKLIVLTNLLESDLLL